MHGEGHWGRHWGPWSVRGRFFGSGELRLAHLDLLKGEPKHGYQLMKELEERSGGLYQASAGSTYPTLQQLEDEGLVVSEQRDGKRIYRATEAGLAELETQKATVRRIWQRAEGWENWSHWMGPEAMTMAGPVARLMKAALSASTRAAGEPARLVKVQELLDRTRQELEQM
ncbi:MAG: PadR family transcriptional regulator [Acidobacteria bacterium]|nr:PadR family transcriptional regulator [Acidobacteriota bacterium]